MPAIVTLHCLAAHTELGSTVTQAMLRSGHVISATFNGYVITATFFFLFFFFSVTWKMWVSAVIRVGLTGRQNVSLCSYPCWSDRPAKCESLNLYVLGWPAGWPAGVAQKLQRCNFTKHHKCDKIRCNFPKHHNCDKCYTLHNGTIHWALPVHTRFSDLDHFSRSQPCPKVLAR